MPSEIGIHTVSANDDDGYSSRTWRRMDPFRLFQPCHLSSTLLEPRPLWILGLLLSQDTLELPKNIFVA